MNGTHLLKRKTRKGKREKIYVWTEVQGLGPRSELDVLVTQPVTSVSTNHLH